LNLVDNQNLSHDESNSFEHTVGGTVNLSKKKQQYITQDIVDRSGAYSYADDPLNYKKARKRQQNRESAVRSRTKKKEEVEILEAKVRELE